MKILFLTDNFPPEVNAPASRTYDHVLNWVGMGHDVTVITSNPNFPNGKIFKGYKNKLYSKENINGIKVIRVWTYIAANKGVIKRTLDFISFSIASFISGLFQKCDIIIATSPQFFTALSGRALSFFKRVPWVMEVRDLWPESIKSVGVMQDNIIIRFFEWQEKLCYKSASKIVVVTDSFKKILVTKKGVDNNKIFVVKNGVNRTLFNPIDKDNRLKKNLGLSGKKIIGYIGTHGMAHKLDFILKCAQNMQGTNDYHFLFIGSGAERANLLSLQKQHAINNVTLLPTVPKNEVSRYISILDLSLINLKKSDLFRTVIPSKIFENAAMEIPIIMGVEGEAQKLVESYGAGLCFEPENVEDFTCKLNQLLTDKELYNSCKDGCSRLAVDFDRAKMAKQMLKIIMSI